MSFISRISRKSKFKVPRGIFWLANLIDRWQWAVLLLGSPFFLFSGTWNFLVLLIVPILWINALLAGKNPIPTTPLNVSILILAFMILISLYATYDINISLPNLSNIVFSIAIFFLIVRMSEKSSQWMHFLIGFLLGGIVISGLSIISTGWFLNKFPHVSEAAELLSNITSRLRGDSRSFHPNIIAGTFLWIMPVCFSVTFFTLLQIRTLIFRIGKLKTLVLVVLTILLTGITSGVVILAQSRSAYLGLFTTFFGLLFFLIKKKVFRLIYISTIIIGIFAIVFFGGKAIENLTLSPQADMTGLSLESLQGRLELWSRAIYMIQDFPFTGVGMGSFQFIIPVLYPLFSIGPDVIIPHAHNEFFQVAVELGMPGLISFIAFYMSCFSMTIDILKRLSQLRINKPLRQTEWIFFRYIIIGLSGGLFAHMIFGFTDAVILTSKPSFIFFVVVGLITSVFLWVNDETRVDQV